MQPDNVQLSLSPELEARLEQMEQESIQNAVMALLRSRKFLLAVFGVIQTIIAHYFDLPVEVWGAIDTLVLAVIAGIAYEDGAEKRAS